TIADAALFMLRAGGRWEESARSNVAVALRTQRDDGAFPAAHHVGTGEAVAWEGTAGMAWIPALVAAGHGEEGRRAGEDHRACDGRRLLRADVAREPRVLPPVRRARGRRLQRAARHDHRALLPDRVLPGEGHAAHALARLDERPAPLRVRGSVGARTVRRFPA